MTGVKAHTLRAWEKRYGICRPYRDANNVRQYCEKDLQHLIKISHLNHLGYKISVIAELSPVELDSLYEECTQLGQSDCCILDKLILAIEKTQESKLYMLLKERLDHLGIQGFATQIWEPMQKRLGLLVLSGGFHKIHLRLFDQIVERLIETENVALMMNNEVCQGSALLINTCGKSTSILHHMVKRVLIKMQRDVVSLSLCQSDWHGLENILKKRTFHQILIHYQSQEFSSAPPYAELDKWILDDVEVIIYGSNMEIRGLPDRWKNPEMSDLLRYLQSLN
jgi:DNA-binding transcriptional MerR regulator